MKLTREFYIPQNAEKREYPEIPAIVYTTLAGRRPRAVCFGGRRTKPDLSYSYRSVEDMERDIAKWLNSLRQEKKLKEQRRQERELSGPASSAKILKGYLQQFFPGVKFSVTSETYSMGSSISVRYTDGPLYDEVSGIAKLFQHGWFDGMTDSYNYQTVKVGCSGAKYVSVTRSMSPELRAALLPILKERHAAQYGRGEHVGEYAPSVIEKAEMTCLGITGYEVARRTQEKIDTILVMAAMAE